jgi:outer membrane protein insertion porin family
MISSGQSVSDEKIRQEIQNVYNLGYFKDDINYKLEKYNDGYKIIIYVSENPIIKDINIKGNTLISESEIRKYLDNQIGKTLNYKDLKSSLENVRDIYVRKGFNGVFINPDIQENGNINLKITEGVIEDILIQGHKETKDYVIRRELRQKSGEIYNSDIFEEDKRRLINTNFFETVDIKYYPGKINPENIIVIVDLKERALTGTFNPGLSYSVRDGLTGGLSLSKDNLLGTGQSISLDLRAGGGWFAATSGFNFLGRVDWSEPWFFPEILGPRTGIGFSLYRQRENNLFQTVSIFNTKVDNISSTYAYPLNNDRTGITMSMNKAILGDPVNSPFRVSLSARAESLAPIIPYVQDSAIKEGNIDKKYEDLLKSNKTGAENLKKQFDEYVDSQIRKGLTISQKGYDNRVAFGLNFTYDTRDFFMDPHYGSYNSLLLEPSVGDINYFKIYGNFSQFIPIPLPITNKLTLALNAQIGILSAEKVSMYERFYSSANQAIRGWPENGYFNGERIFLGTAELRFPIYEFISGVLFVDTGNFWDQNWKVTDYNVNDNKTNGKLTNQELINQFLRFGYGLGIRVNTPLGMLRLDYGIRDLNKPFDLSSGAQLHFNMGQKF